jgi:hypothetical protein
MKLFGQKSCVQEVMTKEAGIVEEAKIKNGTVQIWRELK